MTNSRSCSASKIRIRCGFRRFQRNGCDHFSHEQLIVRLMLLVFLVAAGRSLSENIVVLTMARTW